MDDHHKHVAAIETVNPFDIAIPEVAPLRWWDLLIMRFMPAYIRRKYRWYFRVNFVTREECAKYANSLRQHYKEHLRHLDAHENKED